MNLLERLLHEQYHTTDGEPVVFCCRECDYTSLSVGAIHAHAEQHRDIAIDPFGLIVPPWRLANVEALWQLVEIAVVDSGRTVDREAVAEL